MTTNSFVTWQQTSAGMQMQCQGAWVLSNINDIAKSLKQINWSQISNLVIDGQALTRIDSSGAWELQKIIYHAKKHSLDISLENFNHEQQLLLDMIAKQATEYSSIPKPPHFSWLYRLGERAYGQLVQLQQFLAFFGEVAWIAVKLLAHPTKIRWRAFFSIIEINGYQALPLIGLLSFLVGIVLTYQMSLQLKTYGANVFIVDLLGFTILREFGPLMTAIIAAGRTGSAFTAQLGTMQLNEEIDALRTMGVSPSELLVLPRLIGLIIALPLLTMWANIFGILGGMLMAKSSLGITFYDFLERFSQVVTTRSLYIGLIKTPIFALLISSIGCFQGMQVAGGADQVGRHTTRSVVQAIFCIIIADALFSILFTKLRV